MTKTNSIQIKTKTENIKMNLIENLNKYYYSK